MPEQITPQEQILTPEKSAEELYLDALEKKRDTLLAFHTMNSFRRGKEPGEMSPEEIEKYKTLREEWRSKKETSFGVWDTLTEDKQQEFAAMGSRLYDVQAKLTLLRKPKEEVPASEAAVPPATEEVKEPAQKEPTQEEAPVVLPESAEAEEKAEVEAEKESAQPVPEKPESALSLADVDDYIARLENSSPQPLLAIEAWKAKRNELKERQEAETNPDQTPPKGFMQRVRDVFDKTKESVMGANRISGGSETVESRMNSLGLREIPSTSEAAAQPEAEPKMPTKWGWFKERAKGVWNFGIWEFHQAERFRSKTREVANEAKALATLIQEERDMTPEAAEKEAWEIVDELKSKGLDISAPEFYQVSSEISEEKRKKNDEEREYIVMTASNRLLDELPKYRGEAGQDVLTEENKLKFQADLRMQLDKLRDGFMKQYTVDLAEVMRRNLDENWWRRYIWGTAEAALGFAGVKFLTVKAADWWAAAKMAKAAEGAEAAKDFVMQGMNENVWHTLDQMAQNGPKHLNLDPVELKSLAQKVLETNGMFEPEWTNSLTEGLRNSRALPQGLPLKIPTEVMAFLGY